MAGAGRGPTSRGISRLRTANAFRARDFRVLVSYANKHAAIPGGTDRGVGSAPVSNGTLGTRRSPRHCGVSRRSKTRGFPTDAATSLRMAGIRQHSTKPELAVRRPFAELGASYRISNRDLPGSPDIANRRQKWAIFVHGCYWHRHAGCARTTTPTRNRAAWKAKFAANVARDRAGCRIGGARLSRNNRLGMRNHGRHALRRRIERFLIENHRSSPNSSITIASGPMPRKSDDDSRYRSASPRQEGRRNSSNHTRRSTSFAEALSAIRGPNQTNSPEDNRTRRTTPSGFQTSSRCSWRTSFAQPANFPAFCRIPTEAGENPVPLRRIEEAQEDRRSVQHVRYRARAVGVDQDLQLPRPSKGQGGKRHTWSIYQERRS